jgi:hypothetical protein
MVTLWDTLTILPLGSAIGGALAAARAQHAGPTGLAAMAVYGFALGIVCVGAVRYIGVVARRRDVSEGVLPLLYSVAGAWVIVVSIVAFISSKAVLGS